MSEEQFIIEDGKGAKLVPVEIKDHSKDPKLTNDQFETLKRRAEHEDATTKDVVGPMAISPELLAKVKKKRGRPAKKVAEEVKPVREWYCSTCREHYSDSSVMKMGAGTDRYAVFCPNDQKFLSYVDEVVQKTVKDWADNNPTGK